MEKRFVTNAAAWRAFAPGQQPVPLHPLLSVVGGHFVGFLAPHWLVSPFLIGVDASVACDGRGRCTGGVVAIVGLSILLYRRLSDPRIRINSAHADILVLAILWLQLALGLATIPLSLAHMDGAMFETLSDYVKGVVTFQPGAAGLVAAAPLVYKIHIALGFTIFLISPFTRLVHIWSGMATVGFLVRPHQIVRKR